MMKREESSVSGNKVLTEAQKKKRFLEEMRQLHHKSCTTQKEYNTVIFNKRSEFRKDFVLLEELSGQYEENERSEKVKLKQNLGRIKSNVEKFQRSLKDLKPSPKFVEKLKEIMEDIESSIMTYKAEQRENFEQLLHDERIITQELNTLEKKFEAWSRLPAAHSEAANARHKSSKQTSSLPPAVATFERFLVQTGGHEGGWDTFDHQEFLKLKLHNKTKNVDLFIDSALSNLPGKSPDDIRQHIEWYNEYLGLLELKKKAIAEWKIHKEAEKVDLLTLNTGKNEESEEKIKRRNEQLEQERKEKQERLSAWKMQRNLEKLKKDKEEERMELEKMKQNKKEDLRRHEIKNQVKEFAKQREEDKEMLRFAEEQRKEVEKEIRKLSEHDIARLRQRNDKMVTERRSKLKSKEMEQLEREKRLDKLRSQVEVHAERDPNRLLQLTKGLKERKKALHDGSGSGQVLHMPHRAVPSWRQNRP